MSIIIVSLLFIFATFFLAVSVACLCQWDYKHKPKMFITKNWVLILGGISMFLLMFISLMTVMHLNGLRKQQSPPQYKLVTKELYEKIK